MNSEQFTYWLNGFAELTGTKQPSEAQWKMIVEHLGLIFNKVTPKLGELPTLGKPFPVIGPSPVPQFPVSPPFVDNMPKIDPSRGWPYQITC